MKPIRGGLVSGVGAIVALLALFPAISWATYPGANGRIAYTGRSPSADTYSHIFSVLPSGERVQQLTDSAASDGQASWSADGQRLAYVGGVPGVGYQVFTMSADGENQTRVTYDNGEDRSPHFSPSGRRIIYAKDNLDVADEDTTRRVSIFKVRPDGTRKRRLVTGYVQAPTYSPTGNRIVFEGVPKGKKGSYAVWTVHRDGSHLRRLTDPERAGWDYDKSLDWSPDGLHILFQRCDSVSRYEDCYDWVMRPDGSHKHPVDGTGYSTVYSPSGRRFAFSGDESDDFGSTACSDIYTTSLTGSDPHVLTHNCEDFHNGGPGGRASFPSWQPIPQP
jgi:Tol biopolymer transport system component